MSRGRFDELKRALEAAVLDGGGETRADARRAAAAGGAVPDAFAAYVAKVRAHAYKITDEEVAAALAGGTSEDALFEMTCAAAIGAAGARYDRGLAALDAAVADAGPSASTNASTNAQGGNRATQKS
jgi:hypothetical protein